MGRQTHSLALLELTTGAYQEILTKLRDAEYHHAIDPNGTIDMHGIGVIPTGNERVIDLFGLRYATTMFEMLVQAAPGTSFRVVRQHSTVTIEPWAPKGWIIDNGKADDDPAKRYRYMNDYGLIAWTTRKKDALRFARREDADKFSQEDVDAWCITPYTDDTGDPMHISFSVTGIKAEALQRLKEPGNGGTLAGGEGVAPPNELEQEIRAAIAKHLARFANDGTVSVGCSISLNYQVGLTPDGKEIPADSKT